MCFALSQKTCQVKNKAMIITSQFTSAHNTLHRRSKRWGSHFSSCPFMCRWASLAFMLRTYRHNCTVTFFPSKLRHHLGIHCELGHITRIQIRSPQDIRRDPGGVVLFDAVREGWSRRFGARYRLLVATFCNLTRAQIQNHCRRGEQVHLLQQGDCNTTGMDSEDCWDFYFAGIKLRSAVVWKIGAKNVSDKWVKNVQFLINNMAKKPYQRSGKSLQHIPSDDPKLWKHNNSLVSRVRLLYLLQLKPLLLCRRFYRAPSRVHDHRHTTAAGWRSPGNPTKRWRLRRRWSTWGGRVWTARGGLGHCGR